MAVREPFMVFTGRNKNEYTITPNFGEGIVVRKIYVSEDVGDYLLVYIGKSLVGFWNLGVFPFQNNLFLPAESVQEENLYNYLVAKGIFRPYKVAEGETITFKTLNNHNFSIIVVYETHDAQDIDPTIPGGSKSDEYDFIHFIKPSTIELESVYDTPVSPSEFPAFPAGAEVPAGKQIVLHGVIGIPVFRQDDASNPTNQTRTRALKFIYNRKVLFDEEKVGLPFIGPYESGQLVNRSGLYTFINPCCRNYEREPFLFPNSLVFSEGEELEIRVVLEQLLGDTPVLQPDDLVIGLIETVKPAG